MRRTGKGLLCLLAASALVLSWGFMARAADEAPAADGLRLVLGERLREHRFAEARQTLSSIRNLTTAAWVGDVDSLITNVETCTVKVKAGEFAEAQAALQAALVLAGTKPEVEAVWALGLEKADLEMKAGNKAAATETLVALHAASANPLVREVRRTDLLQRLAKNEQFSLAEALLRREVGRVSCVGSAYIVWGVGGQLVKRYGADGQRDKALGLLHALRGGTPPKFYDLERQLGFLRALNDLDEWPQLQPEIIKILNSPTSTAAFREFAKQALGEKLLRLGKTDGVAKLKAAEEVVGALDGAQRDLELLTYWLFALQHAVKADPSIARGMDAVIDLAVLSQEAGFADTRYALTLVHETATKAAALGPEAKGPADQAAVDLRVELLMNLWRAQWLAEAELYHKRSLEMKARAEQEFAKGNDKGGETYLREEQKILEIERRYRDNAERKPR